jgi:23S rRNA pseudouridine2605 synthase
MAEERLQKLLAAAGIASRRHAEEMITSGRVSINGEIVTELGTKADPDRDKIRVDGKPLGSAERKSYLLLNKPKGYVTTVSDPQGRPTVMDLVRGAGVRVYPVGRLDFHSEGLLLMTNDGELARKLTDAASHVPKTYLVKVSGQPSREALEKLRGGVVLQPGRGTHAAAKRQTRPTRTAPAKIKLLKEGPNPWFEVTLIEGKNRQIRRMFETVGHHVEKIKRVIFGPLMLDVEPGRYRHLTAAEVKALAGTAENRARKSSRAEQGSKEPPSGSTRKSRGESAAHHERREHSRRGPVSRGHDSKEKKRNH